jgi:hypothetical protein
VAGSGVAESADSTSDAESSVDAEEETIETIDLDREIADLEALQKRALIALSRALMKSSTRKRAIRQATASLAKVRDKIAAIRRELDGLMKDDFDRANVLPSGMKPGSWEARSWLGRNPQVRVSRLGRQERERARILMAELPAWEHTRDSLEHTIQQIEGSRAPEMTDVRASLETILTEDIGSVAAVNLGVAREALRGKHTVIQRLELDLMRETLRHGVARAREATEIVDFVQFFETAPAEDEREVRRSTRNVENLQVVRGHLFELDRAAVKRLAIPRVPLHYGLWSADPVSRVLAMGSSVPVPLSHDDERYGDLLDRANRLADQIKVMRTQREMSVLRGQDVFEPWGEAMGGLRSHKDHHFLQRHYWSPLLR